MLNKTGVIDFIKNQLDEKAMSLKEAIDSLRTSRDSEDKSSAGDKHETSRAMAQIELDGLSLQYSKNQTLRGELEKINPSRVYDSVDFGSLVHTNRGVYLISVGLGKIVINNHVIYAISMKSPVGQILKDKTLGDSFNFNNMDFEIQNIE